MISYSSW